MERIIVAARSSLTAISPLIGNSLVKFARFGGGMTADVSFGRRKLGPAYSADLDSFQRERGLEMGVRPEFACRAVMK